MSVIKDKLNVVSETSRSIKYNKQIAGIHSPLIKRAEDKTLNLGKHRIDIFETCLNYIQEMPCINYRIKDYVQSAGGIYYNLFCEDLIEKLECLNFLEAIYFFYTSSYLL